MKILFFCRLFYPHVGGVEKHVMEISKRLLKEGHEVTVITEKFKDDVCLEEKVEGIQVYRIPVGEDNRKKKFKIWWQIWKLRKLIEQADVVHCHDVFFWYLPFRFVYRHKPVYTTFHGYEGYPISHKAIRMRRVAEKLSWGNICIGDFIQKWYGTKPTFVSYGAVDGAKFKMQNVKYKKDSGVFIGRLDEQTGILTYVKVVELLKKQYPAFELAVIGAGQCRNLIEKKVKMLGWQIYPEKYLEKYHFAFVSGYLAILEALAARKLVFAIYDNPVKEDYLKMTPFANYIVIVENLDVLHKKILYYLAHPEAEKKMTQEGYECAKKQTWEKLMKIYQQLWLKNASIASHK